MGAQLVVIQFIESLKNPKIKALVALRKKRQRDQSGAFLIEGYRELTRAFDRGTELAEVFFCSDLFLGSNEKKLLSHMEAKGIPLWQVSAAVFQKISYRDRPDGLIARGKKWASSLESIHALLQQEKALIVVAVGMEKPGNLGTILRSCDACGVQGVLVCDQCTDVFNPNVVRASTGTLFTQPIFESTSEELFALFETYKVQVVAATPGGSQSYTEIDYTQKTALIMGCEQYGLDKQWLQQASKKVFIPMKGVADSLNVAMACTVLCYEALRQRSL